MNEKMSCKQHPDAPHGFDRNASHTEDRYVCECEHWEPPTLDPNSLEAAVDDALVSAHIGTLESFKTGREALHALISWEVKVALDPLVSKEAASLLNQGRGEALAWMREMQNKCTDY